MMTDNQINNLYTYDEYVAVYNWAAVPQEERTLGSPPACSLPTSGSIEFKMGRVMECQYHIHNNTLCVSPTDVSNNLHLRVISQQTASHVLRYLAIRICLDNLQGYVYESALITKVSYLGL